MQGVITIGRRLIPSEHIAFVEIFDPASNPDFRTEKVYKSRVVLLNRDTVLAEAPLQEFAAAHGFCVLAEDNIAVNPAVGFRVETFTPTESFKPEKTYATRLRWRDLDGNEHSRLLVAQPEAVLAVVLRRDVERDPVGKTPQRPTRSRATQRRQRKLEAVRG